jgi:signal peptidase II
LLLWVTLPLFLLDQATRWWILQNIPTYGVIPVWPGVFNLVHVYNTGAAFGMGKDNNWFFLALAAVALCILLFCWFKNYFVDPLTRVAVSILMAGVAGNLLDRILHGHVVDFLDVILPWYGHWPSFNVADSCICIAAGLLIIGAFFAPAENKRKTPV